MEPKITGFVGANVGCTTNAAKDVITVSAFTAGAKAKSDGYYVQAEGGYGRVAYAKLEAGKEFKLEDGNLAIDASLGGQYMINKKERSYYETIFDNGANSPEWKSNDTRGYGQVALTYNTPSFKASFGVRGGVKTCTQPSLDGVELAPAGHIVDTEYAGRTTKGYITPVVQLEAGKKLRFTAGATLDELRIGGKLYF